MWECRTEISVGVMYGSAFMQGNQTSSFKNRRQMIGWIGFQDTRAEGFIYMRGKPQDTDAV